MIKDTKEAPVKDRTLGLGGTDAAALFGYGRFGRTAVDVYLETVGEVKPAELTSDIVEFGNRLEPIVADKFAEERGVKLRKVNRTIRHKDHPFMIAHPDREIVGGEEKEILECKTAFPRSKEQRDMWGEPGTDQVPLAYLFQVMHYLAVTGAEVCHLAVLINGHEFRTYEIRRQPETIAKMIAWEAQFWNDHIIPKICPEPTTVTDYKLLYGISNGLTVQATEPIIESMEKFWKLKMLEKAVDTALEVAKLPILKAFGDDETLALGEVEKFKRKVLQGMIPIPGMTYKTQPSRNFDVTRFKVDHPDLYTEYVSTTTTRVLRISKGLKDRVGPLKLDGIPGLNLEETTT